MHRGIVHGGVSAMIIDEALGAFVYLLKREGVLGPGVALTAQLDLKFKKVSTVISIRHSCVEATASPCCKRQRWQVAALLAGNDSMSMLHEGLRALQSVVGPCCRAK